MNLEILRFIIGTIVLIIGLLTFALEVFGSYRYEFVLNRMHAAALGDTLGIGISLTGLIIFGTEFYQPENAACHRFFMVCVSGFFSSDLPSGGHDG